jgi:succinyl-CoA synthetase beta subunit/citryl-CoA synthetase large subunit
VKLTEDRAKALLREHALPVPDGHVARTIAEVEDAARSLNGPIALKALVAAGRRGKAGLVALADDAAEGSKAAAAIFDKRFDGRPVNRVYVERQVQIARELYLSFAFGDREPQIIVSCSGGVDIEEVFATDPSAVIRASIDPLRGLRIWEALEIWKMSGLSGRTLASVARMTSRLYDVFVAADAQMLEINPLAIDPDGIPQLVGAMIEIDDDAASRHPNLGIAFEEISTVNPRERAVLEANRSYPGGASRYTELDGDIGLLVAGGGAGLLQHDLIVQMGGRPANHSDMSPAPGTEKMEAVLDGVFTNPRARSLLIGYNYLQMAPCDQVIKALVNSAIRNKVDARRFPIVIRLFGPKEKEARELAATIPGINYLAHGATLEEGVRAIVEATRRVTAPQTGVTGA